MRALGGVCVFARLSQDSLGGSGGVPFSAVDGFPGEFLLPGGHDREVVSPVGGVVCKLIVVWNVS